MKKTFLLVITITSLTFCQSFKADKVIGNG